MPTHFDGTPEEVQTLNFWIKLLRVAHGVEEAISGPILGAGLTMAQFGVLDILYFGGATSLGTIAKKHLKSPNNMTTVVDTMERKGLVQRVPSKTDRRQIFVELTEAGSEAFIKVWPSHLHCLVKALSPLSSEQKEIIAHWLKQLDPESS